MRAFVWSHVARLFLSGVFFFLEHGSFYFYHSICGCMGEIPTSGVAHSTYSSVVVWVMWLAFEHCFVFVLFLGFFMVAGFPGESCWIPLTTYGQITSIPRSQLSCRHLRICKYNIP